MSKHLNELRKLRKILSDKFTTTLSLNYIEAAKEYTLFYLVGEESPIMRKGTLRKTVINLNWDDRYVQVHKSYIVNKLYIREVDMKGCTLLMEDNKRVPMSRNFKKLLRSLRNP